MYWPIGSPDAFAADGQFLASSRPAPSEIEASELESDRRGTPDDESGPESPHTISQEQRREAIDTAKIAHDSQEHEILAAKASRGGNVFATITRSSLTVWNAKPTVALATVQRSARSMQSYGPNVGVSLRPDALIFVVQTELGYLITYSLAIDSTSHVYRAVLPDSSRHTRSERLDTYHSLRRQGEATGGSGPGEAEGVSEVHLRFRMVIRIDAGISCVLAVDEELVVATQAPAAVQRIRWVNDRTSPSTRTELLSKMSWLESDAAVASMTHERSMNLTCWLTSDGRAYAVPQRKGAVSHTSENGVDGYSPQGFCFFRPHSDEPMATQVAINAKFSLIAIGQANGSIQVYIVKDYAGNITLSHKVKPEASPKSSGKLSCLSYSPDGHCLFAGYEHGWAMWSTYGKSNASSFGFDQGRSIMRQDRWLSGARDAFWLGQGCELAIVAPQDDRIWILDIAREAATTCPTSANISQGLVLSSNSVMLYKGDETADLTAIPSDAGLWHTIRIPPAYLASQWPIRCAAVSADGKYIAVSGTRGLAHYSVASGRWKTFDDPQAEVEFVVRGGMCWYQHFLVVSVQTGTKAQIRIYSRERSLGLSQAVHTVDLTAPVVSVTVSGTDSLLVYTHDNILRHFIFAPNGSTIRLLQVGEIGFHGIIRAPARVRSISWLLPEDQLEYGDPSQDILTASVLFLVDAKLVLLQPSTNDMGELKYDMRVLANNVEYYTLIRDQPAVLETLRSSSSVAGAHTSPFTGSLGHSLRDSIWYFDGDALSAWSDIQDVLNSAPIELGRELPATVRIPLDFYPMSVLIAKGIIHGWDAEVVQKRDIGFSYFRYTSRTQLFLPKLLHHHLSDFNAPAALHLADSYKHLPYFAHALEILLHDVLDAEVDGPSLPSETALLPSVTSFLSSFPAFLDVVVNCTRKTELRSWQTLFSYLPPVQLLFEQSLEQKKLKTAAGYLLVLHTFKDDEFHVKEFSRLIKAATSAHEWELARELARFLVGIDSTGLTLRAALADAGLVSTQSNGTLAHAQHGIAGDDGVQGQSSLAVRVRSIAAPRARDDNDYFSLKSPLDSGNLRE